MFILWWLLTVDMYPELLSGWPPSSKHQSPDFGFISVSSIPHNNKFYGQSIQDDTQDDSKDIILGKANTPFDDAFIQSIKNKNLINSI